MDKVMAMTSVTARAMMMSESDSDSVKSVLPAHRYANAYLMYTEPDGRWAAARTYKLYTCSRLA